MTTLPHANLHQTLLDHRFDHAVICTYSFDCAFFEGYCLEKFKALFSNANVMVLVDQGVYQTQLKEEGARPQLANVRYLLHPVSLSAQGVFHPKLFLFATKDKGLLVVGSANFTEPGLKTNAELIGEYWFEMDKREEYLSLFLQAFAFLEKVAHSSPSTFLNLRLTELVEEAPWLRTNIRQTPTLPIRLVHNLEQSLWSQFRQGVDAVDTLSVLSPYYDARPELLSRVHKDLAPRHIDLYTQNRTTTLTPEWLLHPTVVQQTTHIHLCDYQHAEHSQYLHAKGIALTHGNSCRLAFGSANFTQSAWLKTARQGNTELILLFDDVSKRKLSPKTLFDPLESAQRLTQADALYTSSLPSWVSRDEHLIHLKEVLIKGSELRCACEIADDVPQLLATLWQGDRQIGRLDILREENEIYKGELSPELQQKVGAASTIISLSGESLGQSNLLLITNLQRIDGGGSVLRQRQTQEAQRDPSRFVALLGEMMQDNDDDELIDFLGTCDIPFRGLRRTLRTSQQFQWQPLGMMKPIGARDVRHFQCVHEAAKNFIERHERRLRRHVHEAELETFSNFIHLMQSMVAVCLNQVERTALSLDTGEQLIETAEWSQWRVFLDYYYEYFAQLYACFFDEYLPELEATYYKRDISTALKGDSRALMDAITQILDLHTRIEARRQSLRVITGTNKSVTARYNPEIAHHQNIFAPHNWPDYRKRLTGWADLLPM